MQINIPERKNGYFVLDIETAKLLAPIFTLPGFIDAKLGTAEVEYRGNQIVVLTQLSEPVKNANDSFYEALKVWLTDAQKHLETADSDK